MRIGKKLRAIRTRKKVSRLQLACRSKISPALVLLWEHGFFEQRLRGSQNSVAKALSIPDICLSCALCYREIKLGKQK